MADSAPVTLYQKREKIYPRAVSGIYARLRVTGVLVLLGLFYTLPWLQWPLLVTGAEQVAHQAAHQTVHQAVLFDLPARKFYLFGTVFWPQDFLLLAGFLILCALSLFFFTALAGRLWCGYACPQTVWTELFLWIEARVEGSRNQQIKRDRVPMNTETFARKSLKHAIWLLLSLFTGFTFVAYFTPSYTLMAEILDASLGPWELFWLLFYGFATYGNAGWMREQVCLYMCPYARFQSAMFDRDTLIIAYDPTRGEPRGATGDCVDCTLCVQVCPTGIDIRDGLQYQCIGCAACIDVCDTVMGKVRRPQGLIRYTTQNALQGGLSRIVRPRTLIYAVLLVLLIAVLGLGLHARVPLELDIIRDRNTLYRETPEGWVENTYTLRIINMDTRTHDYSLGVDGIPGLQLVGADTFSAPAGEVLSSVISLRADPRVLKTRSSEIFFSISTHGEPVLQRREPARFLGPAPDL